MTNEELKREYVKQIRDVQIKYIYYVIALNVAGIAFSVNQVKDEVLNSFHYILGGAVFLWSIGIFFGFQFLFKFQQVLLMSYNWLEAFDTVIKMNPFANTAEILNTTVKTKVDETSGAIQIKANRNYKWSLYSFYLGCMVFVAWQILQMAYFNKQIGK
jgi:hypothetical protein